MKEAITTQSAFRTFHEAEKTLKEHQREFEEKIQSKCKEIGNGTWDIVLDKMYYKTTFKTEIPENVLNVLIKEKLPFDIGLEEEIYTLCLYIIFDLKKELIDNANRTK